MYVVRLDRCPYCDGIYSIGGKVVGESSDVKVAIMRSINNIKSHYKFRCIGSPVDVELDVTIYLDSVKLSSSNKIIIRNICI